MPSTGDLPARRSVALPLAFARTTMAATSHSITLSDDLWRRLERLAACEGVTPERVVERVLVAASEALVAPSADATSAHVPSAHVPSALERAAGLIGSVEGPADLSMREGFGA